MSENFQLEYILLTTENNSKLSYIYETHPPIMKIAIWPENNSYQGSRPNPELGEDPKFMKYGLWTDQLRKVESDYIAIVRSDVDIDSLVHSSTVCLTSGTHNFNLAYFDRKSAPGSEHIAEFFAKPAFDPVLLIDMPDFLGGFVVLNRNVFISFLESSATFDSEKYIDEQSMSNVVKSFALSASEDSILHVPVPVQHRPSSHHAQPKAFETAARENKAAISIVVPNKNSLELITNTIDGVLHRTNYDNFEIIVVDNGTDDPRVLEAYQKYQKENSNFSVMIEHQPFNFSSMVNRGLSAAVGEHYLLLNNDIEVINEHWLAEMVHCLSYPRVGIVGAKLLYPNDTIQHAGVIVGLNGYASHWFYKQPADTTGPANRLKYRQSMTCVTAAAMLISGQCFEKVGHWDDVNFPVSYNDVDYCMRARTKTFRTVWTPHAVLYHHESASRGSMNGIKNFVRFQREKYALKKFHKTQKFEDPAFSPHYKRKPGVLRKSGRHLEHPPRKWWDT